MLPGPYPSRVLLARLELDTDGNESLLIEWVQRFNFSWTSDSQISFVAPPWLDPEAGYADVAVVDLSTSASIAVDDAIYYTSDCPAPGWHGRGIDCQSCPRGGWCPGSHNLLNNVVDKLRR